VGRHPAGIRRLCSGKDKEKGEENRDGQEQSGASRPTRSVHSRDAPGARRPLRAAPVVATIPHDEEDCQNSRNDSSRGKGEPLSPDTQGEHHQQWCENGADTEEGVDKLQRRSAQCSKRSVDENVEVDEDTEAETDQADPDEECGPGSGSGSGEVSAGEDRGTTPEQSGVSPPAGHKSAPDDADGGRREVQPRQETEARWSCSKGGREVGKERAIERLGDSKGEHGQRSCDQEQPARARREE
jgi:hypothetical protein